VAKCKKYQRSLALCPTCKWFAKLGKKAYAKNEYEERATHICLADAMFRNHKTQTCIDCSEYKRR